MSWKGDRAVRVLASDQVLPVTGTNEASTGAPVTVLIRPEAVRVRPDPQGSAVVTVINFRGATTRLQVTLADGTQLFADVSQHDSGPLGFGDRVTFTVREQPVLVAATHDAARAVA